MRMIWRWIAFQVLIYIVWVCFLNLLCVYMSLVCVWQLDYVDKEGLPTYLPPRILPPLVTFIVKPNQVDQSEEIRCIPLKSLPTSSTTTRTTIGEDNVFVGDRQSYDIHSPRYPTTDPSSHVLNENLTWYETQMNIMANRFGTMFGFSSHNNYMVTQYISHLSHILYIVVIYIHVVMYLLFLLYLLSFWHNTPSHFNSCI